MKPGLRLPETISGSVSGSVAVAVFCGRAAVEKSLTARPNVSQARRWSTVTSVELEDQLAVAIWPAVVIESESAERSSTCSSTSVSFVASTAP